MNNMNLWHDLRFSIRQLLKSPGFTITVIATLGLCIGANTAIYSVIDAVLVRPLPYPDAERLGSMARYQHSSKGEDVEFRMNGKMWEAVHRGATKVDLAAQAGVSGVNLVAGSQVKYVQQQRVSAGYFRVLGITPWVGREFNDIEDTAGGPAVAVLSYELWQREFQGDPQIAGRKIELRGAPFTVVGVMPAKFVNSQKADLWTPLRPAETGEGGGTNYFVLARLKPGVDWSEARTEVRVLEQPVMNAELAQRHAPKTNTAFMGLVSLQRALTDEVRAAMLPKWGAVVLILIIGCVNIAGILLARSASRRREIATRMAIGAGRSRVISQLLTESLLLSITGGAVGLAIATVSIDAFKHLGMEGFNLWRPVTLDTRVLLMTFFLSVMTGIIFGLMPALETSRLDIRSVLLEGGRGTPDKRQKGMRQILVAAEIALGVVLLASAGLLIRTLANLQGLEPGFDPHHVLVAQLSLQDARYTTSANINGLFTKSLERIRALPGVEAAAVGLSLPYQQPLNDGVRIADGPDRSAGYLTVDMIFVTPGYFETLQIGVRAGRTFEDRDNANGQPVVVVNDAFARKYLHGGNLLGTHLDLGGASPALIAGIVANTLQHSGADNFGPLAATPTVYVPSAQTGDQGLAMIYTWFSPNWVVRTRGLDGSLKAGMQAALQSIDPKLPFSSFKSMEEIEDGAVATQRYEATLFSIFAGLAMLLATIGIYGLVATSMTQRSREIGIRIALGATLRDAAVSIIAPGLKLAAVGIAAGLSLTWFATKLMEGLVWGVPAHDPLTYISVAILMGLVAILANLLPALRFIRLDLAKTLHQD